MKMEVFDRLYFYQNYRQRYTGIPITTVRDPFQINLEVAIFFPGAASSIPAQDHTFVEMDHEIISTVILLPSAESFKKGCCQLQAKVCARSTG